VLVALLGGMVFVTVAYALTLVEPRSTLARRP
jgi:hypothetical protein